MLVKKVYTYSYKTIVVSQVVQSNNSVTSLHCLALVWVHFNVGCAAINQKSCGVDNLSEQCLRVTKKETYYSQYG